MSIICAICGREIGNKGFSSHIASKHGISPKQYYDKYLKTETDGYCKTCGKQTEFKSIFRGYTKHCSNKCSQLDPEVKAQKANTCINKFGMPNAFQSEKIKCKIKQTNLAKYGVTNMLKLPNVHKAGIIAANSELGRKRAKNSRVNKIKQFELENNCTLKQTLRKQYGQGWLRLKFDELTLDSHAHFIKNEDIQKIIDYVESDRDWNTYSCGTSNAEREIYDYIASITDKCEKIKQNTRLVIPPYEVDIYVPSVHLAIEFNGTYWHSASQKPKNYHFMKSSMCEKQGIRLIHIYDKEWSLNKRKIQQLLSKALGMSDKIYAHECSIKVISNEEAKTLNNLVHLQNHCDATITYGLFFKGKLVQLMSFAKTEFNKNLKSKNNWEIIRVCSNSNIVVINGMHKLFTHFIKEINPDTIHVYCDYNKFIGSSYEKLGMKFIGFTGPNKWWVINRQLVPLNPSKYLEHKNMATDIVWGAGSKKFIWAKPLQPSKQ